jgi:hypothetical protein
MRSKMAFRVDWLSSSRFLASKSSLSIADSRAASAGISGCIVRSVRGSETTGIKEGELGAVRASEVLWSDSEEEVTLKRPMAGSS